jgi:menaquinone-dependent protoporphyrinogen oxidase
MSRVAVLYDSTEGQTAKIARRVAEIAAAAGHSAEPSDVRTLPANWTPAAFDAVILGASVHVGRHSRPVTELVQRHRAALEVVPAAFFSVSLSAAGKTDRQQRNARGLVDEFLMETGWRPTATATFAGALLYRDYGFLKRMLLRWIAGREGGDTDTSRNYEYTDWGQVEHFTRDFLGGLPGGRG